MHVWQDRKPKGQGGQMSKGLERLNAEMLSFSHREGPLKNFKLESGMIRFPIFWTNYEGQRRPEWSTE